MLEQAQDYLGRYPAIETLAWLSLLAVAAVLADWVSRAVLLRLARRPLRAVGTHGDAAPVPLRKALARASHVAPAVVIQAGIGLAPNLPPAVTVLLGNLAAACMVLAVTLAISAVLDAANDVYRRRPDARARPIKGYIQLIKIAAFVTAGVLIVAALLDRSPLLLLSGLGAMAAVLMLVFRDTILSLVASVQLTSNDMVRVGDWIEMPAANADGDVIDIALHTVKIQNFDKTITAIPTHRLITDSFKNWRGMSQSGTRRIMRALLIDQNSIRFLSADERSRLRRFELLDGYIDDKIRELSDWNARLLAKSADAVNSRRITNIGTFRAYVAAYLAAHPRIRADQTQIVRQQAPTEAGLPLQIYCFADTSVWAEYENIQSDMFDHLLAILPEFGLRLYQQPSGLDLQAFAPRTETPARARA